MKTSALFPLSLLVALLGGFAVRADDHAGHDHGNYDHGDLESCACLSEENNWKVDCGDQGFMEAALIPLEENNCMEDCSSPVCKENFFTIQVHHDYCAQEEVPGTVETALHLYEDACTPCEIGSRADDTLPSCPAVNCADADAISAAYQAAVDESCLSDCSSDTCGQSFQTLLAAHDKCGDAAMPTVSELAFHDLEEACDAHDCNTGGSQLVCEKSGGGAAPAAHFLPLFLLAAAAALL